MMDGVGLVAYSPSPTGDRYLAQRVLPHLELDRVPARVGTALRGLP